jgi:serine/threonine protein kinase
VAGPAGAPASVRQRPSRSTAQASLKDAAHDSGTIYTTQLEISKLKERVTYNSYVRIRTLGKGSSGVVELCADRRSGQLHALKFISRKRQRRLALIRARSSAALGAGPGASAVADDIDELTDVAREVSVLGYLRSSPGVVNLQEVIGESSSSSASTHRASAHLHRKRWCSVCFLTDGKDFLLTLQGPRKWWM